jgi:riboflavin kinase/FMN adenylyltransferase
VIRQLQRQQTVLDIPSTVIVFEPQPLEYFGVPDLPPRLTTFREKYDLLAGYGVDRVLCVRFGRSLAEMTADEFVRAVLVDGLGVKYLVVGDDAAARLLGRPYEIFGKVAHGDKRGRDLGFPTANIHLNRRKSPLTGVYAVTMGGIDHVRAGVANLGNRPTVGGTRTILEVHLFDFDREIYGHWVAVRFLYKLRDEQQFESFDALTAQIERDVHRARGYFRSHMAKCL